MPSAGVVLALLAALHLSQALQPPPLHLSQALHQPSPPLDIAVYYEALCPDSRNFIVNQLNGTWHAVGSSVVNPSFIPWGKAKLNGTDSSGEAVITCQHGPEECWGNRLHACVIYESRSTEQRLDTITCLMEDQTTLREVAPGCLAAAGLDWATASACAESEVSLQKTLQFGQETTQLQPPLTSVPTVTVDGSQSGEKAILADLLFFVCQTWQQRTGETPQGCP